MKVVYAHGMTRSHLLILDEKNQIIGRLRKRPAKTIGQWEWFYIINPIRNNEVGPFKTRPAALKAFEETISHA